MRDDLLSISQVAAVLKCANVTAARWLKKHAVPLYPAGAWMRPRRDDVERLAVLHPVEKRPEYEAPIENAEMIAIGKVCRTLGMSLETCHRWLDSHGVPVFRPTPGKRLIPRKIFEQLLLDSQERPGTVCLDRHDRRRRRVARETAFPFTMPVIPVEPESIRNPTVGCTPPAPARIKF
jgi:hypothetical protein